MAGIPIKNIDDLRSEIARLTIAEDVQSVALKLRFSSPSALFATALSIFPKSATLDGVKGAGFFKQDFLGLISRFLLPLTLNKTLFRSSNFLVKALVSVLSQKASNYISEDSVTGVWGKVKGLFSSFGKKKKPEVVVQTVTVPPDPTKPPYSETY
ncbi:hypothetical protein IM792_05530 [Mucilaginibacter sp. JRF]|uniref:hypothetical protein n=1 Tax=Mucilaginibacter sp. JRF TaxID=2780088 RepID=UPI00188009CE|nr:hypothetical protein [Mucilaginibacter sp. JRF]MBE9583901.1 hypothetical protein [Mucilaginibacter sp. JRF]